MFLPSKMPDTFKTLTSGCSKRIDQRNSASNIFLWNTFQREKQSHSIAHPVLFQPDTSGSVELVILTGRTLWHWPKFELIPAVFP